MKGSAWVLAMMLAAVPSFGRAADEFFDSKGVKIRYVSAGEGEAVVLIHGWMADSTMWGRDSSGNTKLSTDGMEGFRFLAIDARGHGKSDKPHEVNQYGVEMAADVIRMLDHLKIKRAHLIGYSMGTFIAGKVAATHPDRVISVIYAGQAPIIQRPKAAPSGVDEVEAFAKAVEEDKGLGSYLLAVTPPDKPKMTLEVANAYTKMMFAGKDVKALAAAGRSFPKLAVKPEELKKATMPTLFLYGGNESESVKAGVAAAREILTGSSVKIVEGGDHMTTLIRPQFGLSIVEFLRAHREKK